MPEVETIEARGTARDAAAAPTRAQRRELLAALLRGRGLERMLAWGGPRRTAPADGDAVLSAIALGSGLGTADRLLAPRRYLSAHLARGVGVADVVARRVQGGLGPHSAAGIAVGIAFALRADGERGIPVAIGERRWVAGEDCAGALALARAEGLAIVVVAIEERDHEPPPFSADAEADRDDYESVRGTVQLVVEAARSSSAPHVLSLAADLVEPRRRRFASGLEEDLARDPLVAYERRLLISGFSRAELDEVRRDVAEELAHELDSGLTGPKRTA